MCQHTHYKRGTKRTFGTGPGPFKGPGSSRVYFNALSCNLRLIFSILFKHSWSNFRGAPVAPRRPPWIRHWDQSKIIPINQFHIFYHSEENVYFCIYHFTGGHNIVYHVNQAHKGQRNGAGQNKHCRIKNILRIESEIPARKFNIFNHNNPTLTNSNSEGQSG